MLAAVPRGSCVCAMCYVLCVCVRLCVLCVCAVCVCMCVCLLVSQRAYVNGRVCLCGPPPSPPRFGVVACREGDFGGGRQSFPFFQPTFLLNPWQSLELASSFPVSKNVLPTVPSALPGGATAAAAPPRPSGPAGRPTLADLFEGGEPEVDSGAEGFDGQAASEDDDGDTAGSDDVDDVDEGSDGSPTPATGSAAAAAVAAAVPEEEPVEDTESTRQRWKSLLNRRPASSGGGDAAVAE
jgi:hypothetical protein